MIYEGERLKIRPVRWRRLPLREVRWMPDRRRGCVDVELDARGLPRPAITKPEYHRGRKPGNAGRRFPASPPTAEEVWTLICGCSKTAITGHDLPRFIRGSRKALRVRSPLYLRAFSRRQGCAMTWLSSTERTVMGSAETKICETCGGAYMTNAGPANNARRRYCSWSCSTKSRHARRRAYKRTPWQERFWKYVPASLPTPDACWEWQGARDHHGYGRIQRGGRNGGLIKAHRASYEIHNGEIPEGLLVCHHCDNPPCVNPHHLFLGTYSDNGKDMSRKGREGTQRGEASPRCRLTDAQVVELREAAAAGAMYKDLGPRFGIDPAYAQTLATGKRRLMAGGPISGPRLSFGRAA